MVRRAALLVGVGALVVGCGGSRTLVVRSDVPAVFNDMSGERDCTGRECRIEISRETCWLFDSSRGYVLIEATTPTARMRAPGGSSRPRTRIEAFDTTWTWQWCSARAG